MPAIGLGVREIRIRTKHAHRVVYLALDQRIYVLHAFEKKTRATPRRDIALARNRLADVLARRRGRDRITDTMAMKVHASRNNVFRDRGFGAAEAESLAPPCRSHAPPEPIDR